LELAILLDTSAFIVGYESSATDEDHYTVPSVRAELKKEVFQQLRLDIALKRGKIRLLSPENLYLDKVKTTAEELGEVAALSYTDMELLAGGLQLRAEGKMPVIVSDDYAVQNVADGLSLRHRSLAAPGITRRFNWIIYCPGCKRRFKKLPSRGFCPICGTTLKRKPLRKRRAEWRLEKIERIRENKTRNSNL
jgi:rRNA maturation endonuclease Nob1